MEMLDSSYYSRPRTVFVEILYGCNLYCTYCYIGKQNNHTRPMMPAFEVTMDILHRLKEAEVEEVILLGGEPMLHPRFASICQAIAELDFPYRGIVTNGTVMSSEKAYVLQQAGFWVDITFRGPDAGTFEDITGKANAFSKSVNAALLLSRQGVSLAIEFDCIPQNYDRLYETIMMLVERGVHIKQVQLHRILPEGDAETQMETFMLSLEQWQVVFEQAARIRDETGIPIVFEDGFPLCLVQPEYRDMIVPCACGFTLLTIGPNGDARYCSCHKEVLGNIRDTSLASLWRHALEGYRSSERHTSACLECDLFESCRGGCSAGGHTKMNEGMDVFHEYFRPIKIARGEGQNKMAAKIIMGQGVLTSV